MEKEYNEKLIDEIIETIKTNVYIYYNGSDKYFSSIKKHCRENINKEYDKLPQMQLMFYVSEVLIGLINCPYLYDYRTLE